MKSLKTIGLFILFVVVGTAIYFAYTHLRDASVQGVSVTESSWAYRRTIFIENDESIILEKDFILNIDTASLIAERKLQNDCEDLRFQESGTLNVLEYQIVSGCNTTNTQIKIRIPSLPIGGEDIYMFYGNPKALPMSINSNNI